MGQVQPTLTCTRTPSALTRQSRVLSYLRHKFETGHLSLAPQDVKTDLFLQVW